jgi:hypothetical protein
MTAFMVNARVDSQGRLTIAANTADWPKNPGTPDAKRRHTMSVFRIDPASGKADVLFTDSDSTGDGRTVRYRPSIGYYALRCWDADFRGRVIFADPEGAYRVHVGHPIDRSTTIIELPDSPARATDRRNPGDQMPRIADVQWVDDTHFMVKPFTKDARGRVEIGGAIEMFETDGSSQGSLLLVEDFSPESDSFYVRAGLLIVIRGNREMQRTALQIPSPAISSHDGPMVVEVYDLRMR